MSTPYFYQQTTRYGIPGVCSFSVSVSYSFSYGKKVNQWDRVGQAGTVESEQTCSCPKTTTTTRLKNLF